MVILGSKSPRRKGLMALDITKDFIIEVANIDEEISYKYKPLKAVKDIAYRKGQKILESHPNDLVITADTIVVLKNEIIGKPIDAKDAKNMLRHLSGKTHIVYTAYFIHYKDKEIVGYDSSKVTFNTLTDELINDYVLSGSPLDKAGAYGMQDNNDFPIVKSVKGSIKNVIGFPTDKIKKSLKKIGAKL